MGQDTRGHWVVQDRHGVCGGIFFDRAAALRFAMFENGSRPQAVILVPGVFELDINRRPGTVVQLPLNAGSPRKRRAA